MQDKYERNEPAIEIQLNKTDGDLTLNTKVRGLWEQDHKVRIGRIGRIGRVGRISRIGRIGGIGRIGIIGRIGRIA